MPTDAFLAMAAARPMLESPPVTKPCGRRTGRSLVARAADCLKRNVAEAAMQTPSSPENLASAEAMKAAWRAWMNCSLPSALF